MSGSPFAAGVEGLGANLMVALILSLLAMYLGRKYNFSYVPLFIILG
ncbi:MAG: hypothetical protein J7L55_01275 [Desulfurococcales archaeon]|nr:hypothetical protein [Desulfurococcales archaeon]